MRHEGKYLRKSYLIFVFETYDNFSNNFKSFLFFYFKLKKKMSEKKMLSNDSTDRENPEVSKIYKEISDFIQVLL